MLYIHLILVSLFGLAQVGSVTATPTSASNHPTHVIRAGADQAPTLISDFKEHNVSATWAAGHPMQWGQEVKKFEYPLPKSPYSDFYGAASDDEKFLVLFNTTVFKIINIDTETVVSVGKVPFPRDISTPYMLDKPGGGYDLLIPCQNKTVGLTLQLPVMSNGTLTGQQIWHTGRMSPHIPHSTSFNGLSADRRITGVNCTYEANGLTPCTVIIYKLDDPSYNLTLAGHKDYITSTAFSLNGDYLSTTSDDGTGKLWDAATGQTVQEYGPFPGEARGLVTNFSPDGVYVVMAAAPDPWLSQNATEEGYIRVYSVSNTDNASSSPSSSPSITLGPFPFPHLYRSFAVEWSPDSKKIAVGTYGQLLVYTISNGQANLVQNYTTEDAVESRIWDLLWLDDGSKISWRVEARGLGVYDFESNRMFWWGPGDMDRWDDLAGTLTMVLPRKGWIGGVESDQTVKFWAYTK